MKKHLKPLIIVVSAVVAAGIATGAVAFAAEVNTPELSELDAQIATVTDSSITLESKQDIVKYKDTMKVINSAAAKEDVEDIITTATFNEYLSASELIDVEVNTGADFTSVEVRLEKDGERLTGFAKTDMGLEETDMYIKSSLEDGVEFVGYVAGKGKLDSDVVGKLNKNGKVYVADISADPLITENVEKSTLSERVADSDKGETPEYEKSIAWELEDAGIISK